MRFPYFRKKIFHYNKKSDFLILLVTCVSILLIILLSIRSPETWIDSTIGVIISLIVAISVTIWSVTYTYNKTREIDEKILFELVFSEIKSNIEKFHDIPVQIKSIKKVWKSRTFNGFSEWLQPKDINLKLRNSYFYIYLPDNAYQALINRGYHVRIKGFDSKENGGLWHHINLLYLYWHKFCTSVQIIENISVTSVELFNDYFSNFKENEKDNKMGDVLFFFYKDRFCGITSIDKDLLSLYLKISILKDIKINQCQQIELISTNNSNHIRILENVNYNLQTLSKLPENTILEISLTQLLNKCHGEILDLYRDNKKMIYWKDGLPLTFIDFYDKIIIDTNENLFNYNLIQKYLLIPLFSVSLSYVLLFISYLRMPSIMLDYFLFLQIFGISLVILIVFIIGKDYINRNEKKVKS